MKARTRSYCAVCQTFVSPGETIEKTPRGKWGHAACAASAKNKALITSPEGDTYRARYSYRGRA